MRKRNYRFTISLLTAALLVPGFFPAAGAEYETGWDSIYDGNEADWTGSLQEEPGADQWEEEFVSAPVSAQEPAEAAGAADETAADEMAAESSAGDEAFWPDAAAEAGDSIFFELEESASDTAPVGAVTSIHVSYTDWEQVGTSRRYRLKKTASAAKAVSAVEADDMIEAGSPAEPETEDASWDFVQEEDAESLTGDASDFFTSGEDGQETFMAPKELPAALGDEEPAFLSDEGSFEPAEEAQDFQEQDDAWEQEEPQAAAAGGETGEEPEIFTAGAVEEAVLPAGDGSFNEADAFSQAALPVSAPDESTATEPAYYNAADGVIRVFTVREDGSVHSGRYLFDGNGVMLYGAQENGGKSYYFRTYSEAVPDKNAASQEKTPWNSTYGQALRNAWRWDKAGGAFSYHDNDGVKVSVTDLLEADRQAGTLTGYFRMAKGLYYCLDKDGKPRTGTIRLTGSDGKTHTYYFDPKAGSNGIAGAMFHNGWLQDTWDGKERWRYFYKAAATIGQMYEHKNIVTLLDTSVKGKDKYLLSAGGYLCINLARKAEDGNIYQGDSEGKIVRGRFAEYGGKTFYYLSNGVRAKWIKCWHRCPGEGNMMYYFGSLGQLVKRHGWQAVTKADGSFMGWFCFDKDGKAVSGQWVDDHTRYVKKNGQGASGTYIIDGVRYYFTPSTSTKLYGKIQKNQIVTYKGRNYFTDSKGAMIKEGWVTMGGKTYYLVNYRQAVKTFAYTDSGQFVYIDKAGDLHSEGWYIENDDRLLVRYISSTAGGFVKDTSKWISGLLYYFDADGYRINDVSDRVAGPYYVVVDRTNGVMTVYNEAGNIPVKAIRVSVGAEGTETPTGTYTLTAYMRWTPLLGPSYGQYGSHVVSGIFVHSIPCNTPSIYDVPADMYYMLGFPASHGCIRCCVADAKWIYYNCDGAAITITDTEYTYLESMKGPLGRPILIPMTGSFDPTDPEVVG